MSGGAATDTSLDPQLTEVIRSVTTELEAYLGYPLANEARTEEHSTVANQRVVFLRVAPVDGITSIKEDASWGFGASTAVSSSDYRLDAEIGAVHFAYGLLGGAKSLQVVYTAGYGATTADIISNAPWAAYACDLQVYAEHRRKGLTTTKRRGGPQGGIELDGEHRLIGRVREILDGHRRILALHS